MIDIIQKAAQYDSRIAVISDGRKFTYGELLRSSQNVALAILKGRQDLNQARVAFMVRPGFEYASVQWGVWRAGGIAVPLCLTYPLPSLIYVIEDSGADTVVVSEEYHEILADYAAENALKLIVFPDIKAIQGQLPDVDPQRDAMILYTSGTTGSPKGVVTTHNNISSQIKMLVDAWKWQHSDHILNVLPLHHVHGIINVMSCALWSGATCEFLPRFDADKVYECFSNDGVNLFMAVPTIYFKLISHWETFDETYQESLSQKMKAFRLMVSGSAALPVSVMDKWETISGQRLLERYGMTEIGMALSNPYDGERRAGHVGLPLPGVEVRLMEEDGNITETGPGEIQVKGPNVFRAYWGREEATAESFTDDQWFKTGDIAEINNGYYRILGRSSVDIIKSGGYKISALEIEEISRKFPGISDCAVVGIPDEEWGEIIGIGVVPQDNFSWERYQEWIKEKIPSYKVPRVYQTMNDLPRNALGKVTKVPLKEMFQ